MTFSSSTAGGKIGIEELVRAFSKAVLTGKARGLPIVALQIGSFRSAYARTSCARIFLSSVGKIRSRLRNR